MSPAAIQRNNMGFIYHRGHSHAGPRRRLEAKRSNNMPSLATAGHSMVWYRPGLTTGQEPVLYIRAVIHTLEQAVADSLLRNHGEIGRFNLVLDCLGVSHKSISSLSDIKKLFTLLQDHFPDRLGVMLLANLSGMAQIIMKMVLPFVTEDVRAKIHIIPSGEEERRRMLLQFLDEENIPEWLGGKDGSTFDSNEYYYGKNGEKCILSEEEIRQYLVTMPYHA